MKLRNSEVEEELCGSIRARGPKQTQGEARQNSEMVCVLLMTKMSEAENRAGI